MNIVITAGGTSEKIDEVRKITNISTGKLASIIAEKFANDKIFYICSKTAIKPKHKNIEFIEIEGTKDLEKAVRKILKEKQINLFIHSMAVSDYMVDYVTTTKLLASSYKNTDLETHIKANKAILTDKKISSYEDDLIIRLIKTPKIISLIKKISPKTILVGFKLLDKVSKEELINVAKKLKEKNKCDYVVANDLNEINDYKHHAYIISDDDILDVETKEEISTKLYEIITKKNP